VLDDGTGTSGASTAAELKNYLGSNRGAVFMIDGVAVNAQALSGTKNTSALIGVTKDYGMTVQPNLAYDLQQNEAISMGSGTTRYVVSYPFWIRPTVNAKNAPWAGVTTSVLGWPSAVTITNTNGWQPQGFLDTSKLSGTQDESFALSPNDLQKLPAPKGAVITLGAAAQKDNQRIVVIGDTQIANDDFLNNSQENRTLVSNLIDWVAADPILVSIPRRVAGRNVFTFNSPDQIQVVQIVDIVLPPIAVAVFGFWWLQRRKRMTRRVFSKMTS
jgi:hypothetical protein